MATTATVSQQALNIAVTLQQNISQGIYEDPYWAISDLCAAVIALADCVNANASTLSTAVSPASINVGSQYSTTQPNTSAVFTKSR